MTSNIKVIIQQCGHIHNLHTHRQLLLIVEDIIEKLPKNRKLSQELYEVFRFSVVWMGGLHVFRQTASNYSE